MPHYNFHIEEKELLAQVSAGDEQAFRDLFDSYYEKLYPYIFGFIKQSGRWYTGFFLDTSE